MALKGTLMLLGIVLLIFFVVILAELAFMILMDVIDERRRK